MRHYVRKTRKKTTDVLPKGLDSDVVKPDINIAKRNVVSALYEHFSKWHPQVITKQNEDGNITLEVQDAQQELNAAD